MKKILLLIFPLTLACVTFAQEIPLSETAVLEQIYGEQTESETLLPMNDLNVEFGYVLYQANIAIESENAQLEVENVRDYAVVYAGDDLQGTLSDKRKKLLLPAAPGEYVLRLYAENIGRITYGPEILDNSKGLFGDIYLDGENIENWQMTELKVRNFPVTELVFTEHESDGNPCFHKGFFTIDAPEDIYLDVSGWGMGEAWINGQYIGSYWEEEKQQSIFIPTSILQKGRNELIVFEIKNNKQQTMKISNNPVFK